MRRIVSIWFPDFSLNRLQAACHRQGQEFPANPGQPFAFLETGAEGLRLGPVDGFAAARGLTPGMRLADARAIAPDLATHPLEAEADAAALTALARWAERFSPWVAMDGKDGMLLDIAGIAHLFGGEAQMLADMRQRFADLGFTLKAAAAPTIGAAHALARFGLDMERTEDARAGLSPLPVAALRIAPKDAATLRRLGLKTVGSLYAIARASLARRFREARGGDAAGVLARLDQALGLEDEPLSPLRPLPVFHVRHVVADPVRDAKLLEDITADLLHRLARKLSRAGRGALRVAVKFFRADGTRAVIHFGMTQASQDPLHMMRLLAPKLDALDAGFGMDAVTIEVEEAGPAPGEEPGFMEDAEPFRHDVDLARLADRILNRAAEAGLSRLGARESHIPERAETLAALAAAPLADAFSAPRPATLLERPEPVEVIASVPDGPPLRFTWRRVGHRVIRSEGPERIAPEWWRQADAQARPRDYYIVEDAEGRRFWLYREGLYGEAGAAPRWFVHGLFA